MTAQTHRLKTLARYYEAIERGDKTFEVRLNDRAFQTGDILILEKWENDGRFPEISGMYGPKVSITVRVTYILQGGHFGIEPRYCVMGIERVPAEAVP